MRCQTVSVAPELYKRNAQDCRALIHELTEAMKVHALRQAATPGNWGFSGDLGHLKERLREMVDFMKPRDVQTYPAVDHRGRRIRVTIPE